MITKVCFKCGETKPLYQFYKHPAMGDGHLNKCKECAKKDVAENYRVKRKQYAEYEHERFKTPERKVMVAQYQRKRRKQNPKKYIANSAVSNAVRDGRITKPDKCSECSAPKPQAHHPDYSKPLEVVWLCRSCHLKHHKKEAYQF